MNADRAAVDDPVVAEITEHDGRFPTFLIGHIVGDNHSLAEDGIVRLIPQGIARLILVEVQKVARQTEQNIDRYYDVFPTTLRGILESHPKDGHSTTYKAFGEAVGVRQQTISQYASGQTQPTADVVLRIAKFFDVSVNYLLTGVSS